MKITYTIVLFSTLSFGGFVFFLLHFAVIQRNDKESVKLPGRSTRQTIRESLKSLKESALQLNFSIPHYLHASEPALHNLRAAPVAETAVLPSPLLITPVTKPLRCIESFPPKCEMYPYVQFWNKKFSAEDCYESPLRHPLGKKAPVSEQTYVVFEPDRGGWNNIRMAAETAMIFAHASGRVLVMPPVAEWLFMKQNKADEENQSTFEKFFDFSKIAEALDVITMDEFMTTVAAKGYLKKPVVLPMGNTLKHFSRSHQGLWDYLESACFVRMWEPGKYFIGFNISKADTTSDSVRSIQTATSVTSVNTANVTQYAHRGVMNPIMEDAHLAKFAAHGRKVLTYGEAMHKEKVIYFPGDYRNEYRILTHFYTYLYWADEHTEHIYKRIVRDRLHYHDAIFCTAGKIVRLLHEEAAGIALQGATSVSDTSEQVDISRSNVQTAARYNKLTGGGDTRYDAVYHAVHIRRGDFQFTETRLTGQQLYDNIKHLLNRKVTKILYISTDEKDIEFFKPFREYFTLRFLRDFTTTAHLNDSKLNQNHIGMVEQTVCANAHTFVGTPRSTFTGYITRMRGYYRDDRYSRTFYTIPDEMHQLHKQPELVGPFWAREFAVAHVEIDDYISQREKDSAK